MADGTSKTFAPLTSDMGQNSPIAPVIPRLLRDEELVEYIEGQKKLVQNLRKLEGDQWYGIDSPIQPCSIDLHIGEIFVPDSGGVWRAIKHRIGGKHPIKREHYVLRSGYAAMVTTAEELNLPSNVAAISFPPNHIAMNGLLMTNAGHIDPGYQGKLRYTLINMGKEDFPLVLKADLVTVLFFEMSAACRADYAARGKSPSGEPIGEQVNVLSKDLVDLEKKISRTSNKVASRAILGASFMALLITIIGAGLTLWCSLLLDRSSEVKSAQREIIELKAEIKDLQGKVTQAPGISTPPPASMPPANPKSNDDKASGGR